MGSVHSVGRRATGQFPSGPVLYPTVAVALVDFARKYLAKIGVIFERMNFVNWLKKFKKGSGIGGSRVVVKAR